VCSQVKIDAPLKYTLGEGRPSITLLPVEMMVPDQEMHTIYLWELLGTGSCWGQGVVGDRELSMLRILDK